MTILVFDIETIPDIQLGKTIFNIDNSNDDDTYKAMMYLHRQNNPNSKILPLFLHKIVAISITLKSHNKFKVWSLGTEKSDEKDLLIRFFEGLDKYTPILISWNGSNFDLPVIQYRALKHGITSHIYWETGQSNSNFRWNNYLNRYHERHTDLMDVLASYSPKAFSSLQNISHLVKLPGKMGLDGSKVYESYKNNDIKSIRNYCEIDVLNTYLIFLRFELIKGNHTTKEYLEEIEQIQNYLKSTNEDHFIKYLEEWIKLTE